MLNDLWYKNAIVYCLSVGTFMDANGDGVGDFQGLIRRLDYLQGLGITTIWLMPFQPSPGLDAGYDISDYYGVDPRYVERGIAALFPDFRGGFLRHDSLHGGGFTTPDRATLSRRPQCLEKLIWPHRTICAPLPRCWSTS